MQFVQPIRDMRKIEEMKRELLRRNYRDYIMFIIGINTGLRISDILQLQAKNVVGVSHITIREQKTSKEKKFLVNGYLKQEIDKYTEGMNREDYLFQSRSRDSSPISRVQAYRILNSAAMKVGLDEIGTHTLRKTFGYHFYQKTKDVALLQKLFNHSAPSVTLRYIGINQDMLDSAMEEFIL